MAMGVPRDFPSKIPDRISGSSASAREVEGPPAPGLRRASSPRIKSAEIASPAGQPSTTQPTAVPWLSPKVITLKRVPKLFPGIKAPLTAPRQHFFPAVPGGTGGKSAGGEQFPARLQRRRFFSWENYSGIVLSWPPCPGPPPLQSGVFPFRTDFGKFPQIRRCAEAPQKTRENEEPRPKGQGMDPRLPINSQTE
jgi:hypothetical protein